MRLTSPTIKVFPEYRMKQLTIQRIIVIVVLIIFLGFGFRWVIQRVNETPPPPPIQKSTAPEPAKPPVISPPSDSTRSN
jgi:hypothetical protein